jgi:hypothetical protein
LCKHLPRDGTRQQKNVRETSEFNIKKEQTSAMAKEEPSGRASNEYSIKKEALGCSD